jgi:hypothetical protein
MPAAGIVILSAAKDLVAREARQILRFAQNDCTPRATGGGDEFLTGKAGLGPAFFAIFRPWLAPFRFTT